MTYLMISFWINLAAPLLFFPFDLVSVQRKCHQTLVLKGFLFLYFSVHQPRDFGGKNREISMCMSKRIPLSFRKFFLERIDRWGYWDRTYRSGSVSKRLLYWGYWCTFFNRTFFLHRKLLCEFYAADEIFVLIVKFLVGGIKNFQFYYFIIFNDILLELISLFIQIHNKNWIILKAVSQLLL